MESSKNGVVDMWEAHGERTKIFLRFFILDAYLDLIWTGFRMAYRYLSTESASYHTMKNPNAHWLDGNADWGVRVCGC